MKRICFVLFLFIFIFTGCTNISNLVSNNKVQVEKKLTPDEAKSRLKKDYGIEYNSTNFVSMVKSHETEKVKLFLQAGIDPNTRCMDSTDKTYYGEPVLMIATSLSYDDIVYVLVDDYKADVNIVDNSQANVLWMVSNSGRSDLVKYFVDKGVNVNYVLTNDNDALSFAVYKNQKEVIKALVENGADIKRNNTKNKSSILNYAIWCKSDEDTFKTLIELGAEINNTDKNGFTPLYNALLIRSKFEIIKALVENGANVNFSKGNLSCLDIAKGNGSSYQEVKDYLIQHGAK